MGLDMYAYRFIKPSLEDRVYERDELFEMGYGYFKPGATEDKPELLEDILPYTQQLKINLQLIDLEKLQKHYGFDELPQVAMISSEEQIYRGERAGEPYSITIKRQDLIDHFVYSSVMECVVFKYEKVAYWRKEYDVQDFFQESIGPIRNTGYRLIPVEVQHEYNRRFGDEMDRLPEEEATDRTAIVYWEWY